MCAKSFPPGSSGLISYWRALPEAGKGSMAYTWKKKQPLLQEKRITLPLPVPGPNDWRAGWSHSAQNVSDCVRIPIPNHTPSLSNTIPTKKTARHDLQERAALAGNVL